MDIQNVLPHMANASVLVNGHEYKTDAQGIVRNVADADAQKMLLNRAAWRVHIDRQAVPEVKPVEKAEEKPVELPVERPITIPDKPRPEPVVTPDPLPVPEFRPPVGKPRRR
jgi:hypothetical protein